MKTRNETYELDVEAVAMRARYTEGPRINPLDAVVYLADLEKERENWNREALCGRCHNWKLDRPWRPGAENPSESCHGCLFSYLEERQTARKVLLDRLFTMLAAARRRYHEVERKRKHYAAQGRMGQRNPKGKTELESRKQGLSIKPEGSRQSAPSSAQTKSYTLEREIFG